MNYTFEPIGVIHSPYREKFGIPRQPSLATAAGVTLQLLPPYNHPDCVRGLEAFSHVWISFVFHQTLERGWQPLVRPPRLGGNAKVGVFASRSTHRPNPLGLSLVELVSVSTEGGVSLQLAGADLLDGTPVLDIKPYIPFVESRPDAAGGFVDGPPPLLKVEWSDAALRQLTELEPPPGFATLVEQVLAQDPRPAYQDDPQRVYGVMLYCYNVRFGIVGDKATVLEILRENQN
ncbi:tRNA (N6-threonylcarbamoyladenosine(37)-N6)-methyltransferase TrmO [Chromobacterium amazonense]|uniref:tRNA (N6-threonylcarbamoyladenosine(37)-N6)-methyltransferase TrmO n=1 Tax=Chromobacterium amazonense TaxID=1382803 RepID=A0ABU8UX04_9NEIS|nr:tRNA (N6-threonylcarbamoyladenosine(37)-N6)-methyltransferase TrmO [Chromobacterium amazonense]MDE1714166.1 tRNA (N6-threonylcarbamoyladenosine(37)-N6)-methyltransferase TrmO [Chromobacterium amazonense]MDQ4540884.1 tRNA (N6-threonylcarbamoyladenosine(37)-N6)-methyltransferase TrmO [Chromobacterium amazonense]